MSLESVYTSFAMIPLRYWARMLIMSSKTEGNHSRRGLNLLKCFVRVFYINFESILIPLSNCQCCFREDSNSNSIHFPRFHSNPVD